MMRLLLKIKTSIGLDIGSHSIKVVGLRKSGQGVSLINFAAKELPPRTEGEEVDRSLIARTIKELFQEEKIEINKVFLAVGGPQVVIKRITLPVMPQKELKEAVRWEARKFISFPIEKAILDFDVLGEVMEEGIRKLDVMVGAMEHEAAEEQLAIIKEAGLKPVGITALPLAMWHAFQKSVEGQGRGATAIIDIGATNTNIVMIKDGKLQFTRHIGTAGNSLTEVIKEVTTSEGTHLDAVQAEAVKREHGIPQEGELDKIVDQVSLRQILFVVRPVLERLVTEIRRSLEFYNSQFKEEGIRKILLCGGGATLKGLKGHLAHELGSEVELFNPLKDMVWNTTAVHDEQLHQMPVSLTVATGLALGRAQELNLLPDEYKLATRLLLQKVAVAAAGCLIILVLSGMYYRIYSQSVRYEAELSAKKMQLADLQLVNTRFLELVAAKTRLEQGRALLPEFALNEPPWPDVLKGISQVVPANATLLSLSLKNEGSGAATPKTGQGTPTGQIRLKGVIFGDDPQVVRSTVELMEGLENSPFFSDIRLSSCGKSTQYGGWGEFELLARCGAVKGLEE